MATNGRTYVYAGAAQWTKDTPKGMQTGLYRSVGDDPWEPLTGGLPERGEIRAIAVHPEDANVVFVGTQDGPYRSTDRGTHWERLGFPDQGKVVWSLLFHPRDPKIMYLGAAPTSVYKSEDGGNTWRRLTNAKQPERVAMGFATRVIRMAADPSHPDEVYAAIEVGGVMRTLDGGESWSDCSADLVKLAERPHLKSKIGSDTEIEGMMDGHSIAVSAARPGAVFVAVRMGLFRSDDRGGSWKDMEVGRFSPLTYARDVQVSPQEARTLYSCLSPAARSQDGSLYRSDDLGETWKRFDHGVKADSTMMALGLDRSDPDQVCCVSRSGQVFDTRDGGRAWRERRLPAGVHDVYAVACAS